jgi:hypothetical protein
LFFFRERKLATTKACEYDFVEKRNRKRKKLKVGMLSTPQHSVQFCINKHLAIVKCLEFEKEEQGFACEKPKKVDSNYLEEEIGGESNDGSCNSKDKEEPKPLVCAYNLH